MLAPTLKELLTPFYPFPFPYYVFLSINLSFMKPLPVSPSLILKCLAAALSPATTVDSDRLVYTFSMRSRYFLARGLKLTKRSVPDFESLSC